MGLNSEYIGLNSNYYGIKLNRSLGRNKMFVGMYAVLL